MIKRQLTFDFSRFSSGLLVPMLIVAGLAFGYFVVRPQYGRLKESQAILKQQEEAVADRRSSVSNIKSLVAELEAKANALSPLEEALPVTPNIPELLANLEFLARQSGMVLENIQIQGASGPPQLEGEDGAKPAGGPTPMQVDLTVSGQYFQLLALVANIETNLRIMDIESVSFGGGDSQSQSVSYIVQMRTYYQKP